MLSDNELEISWVVANRNMNRERQLFGPNSYEKELRFGIVKYFTDQSSNSWLDLCCGTGQALVQLASHFPNRIECHGVDLVGGFSLVPPKANVTFHQASLHAWVCDKKFDLTTCVHGLHYIGDKLGLLMKTNEWLSVDGYFIGHLDLSNIAHERCINFKGVLGKTFRRIGIQYDTRTKLVSFSNSAAIKLDYRYLGADDSAGPNFTGHDAVRSIYTE